MRKKEDRERKWRWQEWIKIEESEKEKGMRKKGGARWVLRKRKVGKKED